MPIKFVFSTQVINVMIFIGLARWNCSQVWGEGCGWQHGAAWGFSRTGTLNSVINLVFNTIVIKDMILTGLYS